MPVDVAVVGAGTAGSAAAMAVLAVRPGARVVLIDRAPIGRDKACGDGIAPDVVDVVDRLVPGGGAAAVAGHEPVHRLALSAAGRPGVSRSMRRATYVVPRAVFDARLRRQALDAGAEPLQHRVSTLSVAGQEVDLDDAVRARVVIGADGVHSIVRRHLGAAANPGGHVALALRGYAPVRPDLADVQRIVFADGAADGAAHGAAGGSSGWPAYAWSFPVGDGRANVGYGEVLRDGRPLDKPQMLQRLDRLLPGVGEGGSSWRAAHLPLSSHRPRQPDGRVLLAGDAASLVNPLTGEGIYYAVRSGELAGLAAAAALGDGSGGRSAGSIYRKSLRRSLGTHLTHTRVAAALAAHPAVVAAGALAGERHQRVFDNLVEVGLADALLSPRTVGALVWALLSGRRR